MLKVNPFYILFFFYLTVNLIFAVVGYNVNNVEIEFEFYNLKSSSFIFAFMFQFFICIVILTFYYFFSKIKKRKEVVIGNRGAIFLLILQFLFLIYNLFYGVNVAGVSSRSSNEILNLFFILLPADLFYIIFSPYIISNKFFRLNTIIFIVSNILRGWMGGVFLAFFVSLCRKGVVNVSFRKVLKYFILLFLLFLLLPYLTQAKWVIRSGGDIFQAINTVNEIGYLKLLEESLSYIFNRFQHNYHVALLWENYNLLNLRYEKGYITPYWAEGIFQTITYSILGLEKMPSLGNQMAHDLFYSKDSWSANPGLAGWLIVLQEKFIFLIIYIFLILFIGFYTAIKYFDNKMVLILGVFSMIYLFHGWIGMYVSMITYLLIISFIRSVRI